MLYLLVFKFFIMFESVCNVALLVIMLYNMFLLGLVVISFSFVKWFRKEIIYRSFLVFWILSYIDRYVCMQKSYFFFWCRGFDR